MRRTRTRLQTQAFTDGRFLRNRSWPGAETGIAVLDKTPSMRSLNGPFGTRGQSDAAVGNVMATVTVQW